MQWYYAKNGTQLGPVDVSVLRNLIATGQVSPSDLVWRDGMPDWIPSSRVPEIQPTAISAGPPPVGGNMNSPYAPPQVPQHYPAYAGPAIANNLWQSIVVTIFCCTPFGIVAIVFAAKVDGLVRQGRIQEAMAAAADSRKWTNISVIAYFAVMVIGGILSALAEKH